MPEGYQILPFSVHFLNRKRLNLLPPQEVERHLGVNKLLGVAITVFSQKFTKNVVKNVSKWQKNYFDQHSYAPTTQKRFKIPNNHVGIVLQKNW